MNMMFGMTELVVDVANGEVASATEAARDGRGSARPSVNAKFNK
jgi:hypothetical protein